MFFWVFPRRQIVQSVPCFFSHLTVFTQPLKVELTQGSETSFFLKKRPTTILRRGNTQKNIHNIQITAKVWNQKVIWFICSIIYVIFYIPNSLN